jgi:sarcosine oxidase, subunit alpha
MESDLARAKRHDPHPHLRGGGVYDHGYVLADERVADHTPGDGRPKHRLWRIRAGTENRHRHRGHRTPMSFAGQRHSGRHAGGGAVRDYLVNYAVSPGDRTVIVTNNDDAYQTAIALHQSGLRSR